MGREIECDRFGSDLTVCIYIYREREREREKKEGCKRFGCAGFCAGLKKRVVLCGVLDPPRLAGHRLPLASLLTIVSRFGFFFI